MVREVGCGENFGREMCGRVLFGECFCKLFLRILRTVCWFCECVLPECRVSVCIFCVNGKTAFQKGGRKF